ncbi:sensor histidine kinase [Streptosporangium sp. NBC_01756]|uniref:sensor histidine kinase n=1 Tax=Streptosporangium sp. NBC_01756 TaxID=2975950 RepID=UPI002DDC53F7|nr:histidine kinase [Streptosporangium sp. NBC_01756]WSC89562.1 histidine kinase [Streptosporangium sp. NBC_01756]
MKKVWQPGPAAFSFWVALVYFPAHDLVKRPSWPDVLGLAVVVAAYLLTVRAAFTGRPRAAVLLLTVLAVATFALCAASGGKWLYLCPVLSIACGVVLRGRVLSLTLAVVTLTSMVITYWRAGGEDVTAAVAAVSWGTFTAGVVVYVTLKLFATIAELHETRQELARAAVAEERLRFSRDLHDLLGHTLSLMVVKAEAVRRLIPRDAEAAAAQAGDIQTIGREALTEVRAAVAGYRGRGFADELAAARVALEDAGVRAVVTLDEVRPAPDADELLGWAVREGVTNVVRHARATRCQITLTGREEEIVLEIGNDGVTGRGLRPADRGHGSDGVTGRGPRPADRGHGSDGSAEQQRQRGLAGRENRGHGLAGLAERAAAAGARFEAGALPGGRFALTMAVPR